MVFPDSRELQVLSPNQTCWDNHQHVFLLWVLKSKYGKIAQPCPKTGSNQEAEGWKGYPENMEVTDINLLHRLLKILTLKLENKSSCPRYLYKPSGKDRKTVPIYLCKQSCSRLWVREANKAQPGWLQSASLAWKEKLQGYIGSYGWSCT